MALVDAVVAGSSPQRLSPAGFAICRPPGAVRSGRIQGCVLQLRCVVQAVWCMP